MAQVSEQVDDRRIDGVRAAAKGSFAAFALTLFLSLAIVAIMMPNVWLGFIGGTVLLIGLGYAGVLWLKGEQNAARWDVPALMVFLGFAACIMSGPASRLLS